MAASTSINLSAAYSSPTNKPFTLAESIPTQSTSSVDDKTQYLSKLRAAVNNAQDQINKELTARMEEDKARDGSSKSEAAKGVDEDKEEENYGEEVQEEED